MSTTLSLEYRGVQGWIWLSRPEVHNAFNPELIEQLSAALLQLQADPKVRVLVLAARGANFCAGADLNWMQSAGELSAADNLADAERLAQLFRTLYVCDKPVIARVQGRAMGGGLGLVAACDIAVASSDARFCLSEVRLGLIPAVIGPYVAAAIGLRQARRYCLTAEILDAERALALGLIHECCAPEQLDTRIEQLATALARGAPRALAEAKQLLGALAIQGSPGDDAVLYDCARRIARLRASEEAREGLDAFLHKRAPNWIED